jgi:hypothetical protein
VRVERCLDDFRRRADKDHSRLTFPRRFISLRKCFSTQSVFVQKRRDPLPGLPRRLQSECPYRSAFRVALLGTAMFRGSRRLAIFRARVISISAFVDLTSVRQKREFADVFVGAGRIVVY